MAELREPLYYFVSDYCDRMLPWRVRETLDPSLDFGKSIIMDSDLNDLRKIVKGGADKSYGIQVAKLAGIPAPVIDRAKELVEELSDADITARAKEIAENGPGTQTRKKVAKPDEVDLQQMSIFDTVNEDDIIKEIMELEVNRMSPLDALNRLDKLQAKLKNRWMHQ